MDPFADIRPFNDAEVPDALQRLLADPEFIAAITRLRFNWAPRLVTRLLQPLVRMGLRRELAPVDGVESLQHVVEVYMSRMIEDTTSGVTVSGLENLPADQAHLFMSNHRDITLDPAFTNYALYHQGRETVRIAIGDNLLTKPYVSDLMRLNKSFIVQRSARGPRQVLKAYQGLSAYIRQSIQTDQVPIWMAQREGRAKDGIDRTEPAIIKMLAMSQDKQQESFGEYIGSLRIVPVSISYELDPCDGMKAAELHAIASRGGYEKAEYEDVASIAAGIAGQKGQVHVAFGQPLGAELDSADAVAAAMDKQIVGNYQLHSTNLYAWRWLHGDSAALPAAAENVTGSFSEAEFRQRIEAMPGAQQEFALGIYANVVASKLQLAESAGAGE
ncbi:MAG: 1-acyl-sn-glycerol-3-phosphate acyltransferase [Gammaproteobacteria bacterium]|nr:1-acyl-sn-glycerol-3-phosphate acyltransferase [Gammaproteobacteria bacterium]